MFFCPVLIHSKTSFLTLNQGNLYLCRKLDNLKWKKNVNAKKTNFPSNAYTMADGFVESPRLIINTQSKHAKKMPASSQLLSS
jgi:hypothetical protein